MAHNQGVTENAAAPAHRVIVVPLLRTLGGRFILQNWLAITIWSWIIAWRPLDDAELAHELCHVRQWHENGFIGYIRAYMAASEQAAKAGKDRYRENKFEVEARKVEDAVRKQEDARPGHPTS
jgi:hypothetical protein